MNILALTLAFLLELVAFGYFAAVSLTLDIAKPIQIALFVALLGALIAFWSMFMAPRAIKKFRPLPYYIAKAMIYAVSTYAIFKLVGATWCYLFVVCALLDEIILFRHNLEQPHKR